MIRPILTLLIVLSIVLLLAAAVASGLAWQHYRSFEQTALPHQQPVRLWLAPGATLGTLARELQRLGLTRADWRWRLLGRLHQPLLRAGEYQLPVGSHPLQLIEQIERGQVMAHHLTIVEGWTVKRLRQELAADSRLVQTARELSDAELMRRLGCSDCYAEGWFLPETYRFERGDRDLDLLARAHRAMRDQLDQAWQNRAPELPLQSADELLILASLIEAETMLAPERAQVSGVFVRRLQRGMRLQTDPTVAYGIEGAFDGRIRRVHLTTDHPWNTYTRHGLPPTPIGLPGAAALQAAAHPADGEALYFVARGDGSHHFSATLAEHNRAVARYILGRQ